MVNQRATKNTCYTLTKMQLLDAGLQTLKMNENLVDYEAFIPEYKNREYQPKNADVNKTSLGKINVKKIIN